MGSSTEDLGLRLASDVVGEAVDEMLGTSRKKWALMLIAALAGAAIAVFVMRRLQHPAGTAEQGVKDPTVATS